MAHTNASIYRSCDIPQHLAEEEAEALSSDQFIGYGHAGPSNVAEIPTETRRPKRKHVVRIVAKRTLADRYLRDRSFGSVHGTSRNYSLTQKDGYMSRAVRYLEPAEMLQGENDDIKPASVVFIDQGEAQFLVHRHEGDSWPLYSQEAIDFSRAASIILGKVEVAKKLVCGSTPNAFTGTGTFVVDLLSFKSRHEIAVDGLGPWKKPQGASRHYRIVNGNPERLPGSEGADVKVLCNRYEHPGTSSEGRFVRKIYSGIHVTEGPLPLSVVVYGWFGIPHSIAVRDPPATEGIRRPHGTLVLETSDSNEGESYSFSSCLPFAKIAVDFDTAVRIILGLLDVPNDRLCTVIPQASRGPASFVIDLTRCETDASSPDKIFLDDDGIWSRPAGCLRYYKVDGNSQAIRVNKDQDCETSSTPCVQVLCRRYENTSALPKRFIRKVYTGKVVDVEEEAQQVCSLAVLTYFFKEAGEINGKNDRFVSVAAEKQKQSEQLPGGTAKRKHELPGRSTGEHDYVDSSKKGRIDSCDFDGEYIQGLRRRALFKEAENQERFAAILNRGEQMLDRFEQIGLLRFPNDGTEEIQYLVEYDRGWMNDSAHSAEAAVGGYKEETVPRNFMAKDQRVASDSNGQYDVLQYAE